ncbi:MULTISPECIES: hypothetical protein [unclassified Pseudomonas]|nr:MULTISPECIES: hypothetical protein [unclassified Pseudomonas]
MHRSASFAGQARSHSKSSPQQPYMGTCQRFGELPSETFKQRR